LSRGRRSNAKSPTSASPLSKKKNQLGTNSSTPSSAKSPHNKSVETAIIKVRERFDSKRREVQRDLDYTVSDRDVHFRNGDQCEARLNKGVYAYVHKV
jgi:hypothetical protein